MPELKSDTLRADLMPGGTPYSNGTAWELRNKNNAVFSLGWITQYEGKGEYGFHPAECCIFLADHLQEIATFLREVEAERLDNESQT